MPYYYPAPDFAAEDISATGAITAVGNISTTAGTVSAEQVTSTDDANVADQLKLTEAAGAHVATPTLAFGDLDTGMYESADDTLNFSSEGVAVFQINTGDQVVLLETPGAHEAAPTLAFGDGDTGMWESADDTLNIGSAGVYRLQASATGMAIANVQLLQFNGVRVQLNAVLSPAQVTGDQTDYNPSGLSTASILRIDLDAPHTINSLAGGVQGRLLWILNVSASALTLLHDDAATGTAAQRFLCPNNASVVIPTNGSRALVYDNTSARWRVLGAVA